MTPSEITALADGASELIRALEAQAQALLAEREAMRGALILAAPHFQGGHSEKGKAIADALGIPFPIRPEALSALTPPAPAPKEKPTSPDQEQGR